MPNEMAMADAVKSWRSRLVYDAISEQTRCAPNAIAVTGPGATLTYAELDRYSCALASRLRKHGAGPECRIGLYSSRSPWAVAAVLGILRAGGSYVPLDPDYPPDRLRFIIKDAGLSTVLVQPGIQVPSQVRAIELSPDVFTGSEEPPAVPVLLENLAYIIYTSGSTGTPKGVMISHAAMLNTLTWLQDTFQLTPNDVVAHKTSISFTDSIWELLWPLMAGAQIAVIEENATQFPRLLVERMSRRRVTVTQFVPAQMRLFLDEVHRAGVPDPLPLLRWVFNGGEALPPRLAGEWYRTFPLTHIANAYGMTESAIYGMNWIVEPCQGDPIVLVGKAIANERAYVLGAADQPCPPLCLGEIHLAGKSLARGYFGRPDLTAELFVPDPFGPPGARMYRTGDLGRQLESGEIACLGRLDRQVKIRGGRVELGEIEAALAEHTGVRQALAVARPLGPDKQIIVYYTFHATDPGPRQLHRFLAAKLPSFMVPAFLVPMKTFPLNPNGKVDRLLLPQIHEQAQSIMEVL